MNAQYGFVSMSEKSYARLAASRFGSSNCIMLNEISTSSRAWCRIGTPRSDGKIEINRDVHKIIETFRAGPGASGGAVSPKSYNVSYKNDKKKDVKIRIQLDVQPLPIEVPRRSFSSDYARQ